MVRRAFLMAVGGGIVIDMTTPSAPRPPAIRYVRFRVTVNPGPSNVMVTLLEDVYVRGRQQSSAILLREFVPTATTDLPASREEALLRAALALQEVASTCAAQAKRKR